MDTQCGAGPLTVASLITSAIMRAKARPPRRPARWRVAEGEPQHARQVQEILHRYRAIHRWEEGKEVYDLTRRLFPVVIPMTAEILDRARGLLDTDPEIIARDALHAAVAIQERLEGVCSYDTDYDRIKELMRREPGDEHT